MPVPLCRAGEDGGEEDFAANACNSKEFALLYILSDYDDSRPYRALFLKG